MNAKKTTQTLDEAQAEINKIFGDGTVMRMSESLHVDLDVISTGILPLDLALECGGYPRGRIVEIFGEASVGKSTLALQAVAEFQQAGHKVLYVDTEHALDRVYAKALGVDVGEMLISQPDSGEQALTIIEKLVSTESIGLVVVDSVAALTPRSEIEGTFGDANVGAHARLMSQGMRKLSGLLQRTNTTSIWINQQRATVGITYGPNKVETGGKALKYYASIRLEVYRGEIKKTGETATHNRTKIKVVKNKCGRPFRTLECDLEYGGKGISKYGCLLDVGEEVGLVKKSGAWYTYEGEQIGQGREKAKAYLADHPETYSEITRRIRAGVTDDR